MLVWLLAGAAACAAGVFALRKACSARGAVSGAYMALGWLLIAAALPLFLRSGENEVAIAFWFGASMVLAYGFVGAALSIRTRKAKDAAANDPEPRPARWHRALARILIAVPLAGLAASALGAVIALHAQSTVLDGLAIAALTQPLLWGAAMAWGLADPHLARPAIGLSVISGIGLAATFLLPGAT